MIQIDVRIFLRWVETNHQPVLLTPWPVKRRRVQAKNPPKPVELETLEILPVDFWKNQKNMDVSQNRGTPKSSILIGFSIINHPFWGTSIFGNTQYGGGF